MKELLTLGSVAFLVIGCATIVNDPMIPVTATFSDGSGGKCEFQNKRGLWNSDIPGTAMIRRSDDPLVYRCETEDGRKATGSFVSKIEGEKLGASVLFLDLGITDAITDKHRYYQGNVVIPIKKEEEQKTK
uniref:Lipoprotein n=1 Tax=Candidatus Kentrum sp. DK TaxID=2126562 RepID=A0A450T3Y5_9GAMM|nr:MAG: hypothetical protein BECKDK2373C_GA0170839_101711 [Candidatus Kentron sp. DK]VFJ61012.1 MAG: hypothetical protein BECKDK2373B_GA0170837_109712 [Candidatus Kentron sp. DK]